MLLSRAVRASWSIAAVLLVATLGRIARADNTAANEAVVGISYEHGHSLDIAGRTDGATVRLAVNAVTEKRRSRNVLADAPAGSDGSLIVVGAHLDSVLEGPGINDNGSGAAAVLEAALRLAREPTR